MMFRRSFFATFFLAAFMLITGTVSAQEPHPIKVTASFSILADMIKQVGGEIVEVRTLVGPGQDSHHYQPKPQDAAGLTDAEILVVNGLHFEGWLDRLIEASGTKAKVLVATTGITPRRLTKEDLAHDHHHHHHHHGDHGQEAYDPHAWQDLKNGELYVRNIAFALSQARPEYERFFSDQAERYIQQIRDLDTKLRHDFDAIPKEKRKVITNHDAFGYFAAAYGVTFYAPIGISMNASPAAKDMAILINKIKDEQIKVAFVENMSSPQLIQQLAKDTRIRLGGALYADALSPPRGPAPTYLDMIAHNAQLILKGLNN